MEKYEELLNQFWKKRTTPVETKPEEETPRYSEKETKAFLKRMHSLRFIKTGMDKLMGGGETEVFLNGKSLGKTEAPRDLCLLMVRMKKKFHLPLTWSREDNIINVNL